MFEQILNRLDAIDKDISNLQLLILNKRTLKRAEKGDLFIDEYLDDEREINFLDRDYNDVYDMYLQRRKQLEINDDVPCQIRMFNKKIRQRFNLTLFHTTKNNTNTFIWRKS